MSVGFKIIKPDGAFYIFAKIPAGYEQDSLCSNTFCAWKQLLSFLVAFASMVKRYLRLSYAASMETPLLMERLCELKNMQTSRTYGLVLYNRNYRENDG